MTGSTGRRGRQRRPISARHTQSAIRRLPIGCGALRETPRMPARRRGSSVSPRPMDAGRDRVLPRPQGFPSPLKRQEGNKGEGGVPEGSALRSEPAPAWGFAASLPTAGHHRRPRQRPGPRQLGSSALPPSKEYS